jgi:hypothetical protein
MAGSRLSQIPPSDLPGWQSSPRFADVGKGGQFLGASRVARPQRRLACHRQIRHHGYHLRLAPTQELTIAVREQAAETLQAHLT